MARARVGTGTITRASRPVRARCARGRTTTRRRKVDAAAGKPRIATVARGRRGRGVEDGGGTPSRAMFVEMDLDLVGLEGERWKLDAVAEAIRRGAVGAIPTDTKYAFVADMSNASAVQKLYDIKGCGYNKPLSILCRGFADIDAYTTGFPKNVKPGETLPFKLAKKCLPGPYTFILPASKELPKVCLGDNSTKEKAKQCKSRKTVGVRIPDCDVTRALLDLLDAPLMCSTVPECDDEPAVIYDEYLSRGLGFMIDTGERRASAASTVVDLSSGEPRILRRGAGDPNVWSSIDEEELVESDDDAAWGFA
ncbi:DHBP synthase RibB-like alpha/beta domain [Ostreococcus tauri]|uniref:Threonylcarbamoyl-AMP synthase n=1 Tax=Ostreococcus tauri TaxID=70448 RepID=Q013B3_OSTTA|nr:DHBP synthase RibB-like alpha/beta domain [Ostreococcus tauri]OUS47031.1 translation factor-like protein [Ostreococcus tauri]CAL55017.1 DHBP synthase RibB-like alpha/beta domain [Ostreococcus tauri]|eukprot:XP_003080849.1 DHBP synthase RibB-like alpha/beta domain [Ostreococcus tauri]